MEQILKAARLEKAELNEEELALINQQTLRPLGAEEVFTFRLAACDNQVDRDFERFTEATLEELAQKYVGRPVLRDHNWSAAAQTAPTIAAIESGILRECSVGLAVKRVLCSICGADQRKTLCQHIQGSEYDGQVCHMDLDGAADAYEVSMVAVPVQPEAGVIKSKRYGGQEPTPKDDDQIWRDKALLELEQNRF